MAAVDTHNPEWDDARLIAHMFARVQPVETVPLIASNGRILASDLVSLTDLPPAHTAMMDGYAVRGDGPWSIVGEVHAGGFATEIAQGQALRVSTGAHIPATTDFVLQEESAVVEGSRVNGKLSDPQRTNVREPGDEARIGDLVAGKGTRINPVIASLAASAGHDSVDVFIQPRIDVIVTGDELISAGVSQPGAIRDSLTVQIPSWIDYIGGVASSVQRSKDSLEDLLGYIRSATGEIIVITGGSAHGPRDFVRPALAELGAQLLVDEIHCKPGHPSVLALLPNGQFVANLPGNPLAAAVTFTTLVTSLVVKMTGREIPVMTSVALHEPQSTNVTRIMPVTIANGIATPTAYRGSAMLRGLAYADAFAVVSAGTHVTTARILEFPWRQ